MKKKLHWASVVRALNHMTKYSTFINITMNEHITYIFIKQENEICTFLLMYLKIEEQTDFLKHLE